MSVTLKGSTGSQSPGEEKLEAIGSSDQTGREPEPSGQNTHLSEHNQDDPAEDETPSISMYLPGKHTAFCVFTLTNAYLVPRVYCFAEEP